MSEDNLKRAEEIVVTFRSSWTTEKDATEYIAQALSEERARTLKEMSGDFCDFCGGKHKIGDCPVNQVTPEYVDKEIDAVIKRQRGKFDPNLLQDDLRDCFSIIVSYYRRQSEESKERTLNSEAVQGLRHALKNIFGIISKSDRAMINAALEKFQQFKDGK